MNVSQAHIKMPLELLILTNLFESTPKCEAVFTAALVTPLPNTMATQSIFAPAANNRQRLRQQLKDHVYQRKEKIKPKTQKPTLMAS